MTIGKKVKLALQQDFELAKSKVSLTAADMIKILREKNEFTQEQLAKETSLSQATISSLEGGRIGLGLERARILAKALHVHPAALLFPDWEEETRAGAYSVESMNRWKKAAVLAAATHAEVIAKYHPRGRR